MFMEIDDDRSGNISEDEFAQSMSAANDFASLYTLFGDPNNALYAHYTAKAAAYAIEAKKAGGDHHRKSVWDVKLTLSPKGASSRRSATRLPSRPSRSHLRNSPSLRSLRRRLAMLQPRLRPIAMPV